MADDSGTNGGNEPQGSATTPTPEGGDKTFTQADLDRVVADRLARERNKFAGFEDLKKKAEEFDKIQDANKSELEKAATRAEAAEKERDSALQRLRERERDAAIQAAALEAKVSPRLAVRLVDAEVVEFDNNGAPTDKSVKAALDQAIKDYPELKGGQFAGSADGGPRQTAQREVQPGFDRIAYAYESSGAKS